MAKVSTVQTLIFFRSVVGEYFFVHSANGKSIRYFPLENQLNSTYYYLCYAQFDEDELLRPAADLEQCRSTLAPLSTSSRCMFAEFYAQSCIN